MVNKIIKYREIILLSVLLYMFPSCKNKGNEAAPEIISGTPVSITLPVIKDLRESVDLIAVSTFLYKSTLRSTVTGNIIQVAAAPAETVKKGEMLFMIRTLEASAIRNQQQADTSLEFKGVIKVQSPVTGTLSSLIRNNGDFVQEGDELAVVSDPNSLVFILEVPFKMINYLEMNRHITINLSDHTAIKGRLGDRLPFMDIQNQTVRYIIVPDKVTFFPENLIASATLVKSIHAGAVVVPKTAVLGNETQTDFWIMKLINDSTAVKVTVRKGIENADEVEILEPALKITDRILTTGNYGLTDTASVIVAR